jgi:hypothetical protein
MGRSIAASSHFSERILGNLGGSVRCVCAIIRCDELQYRNSCAYETYENESAGEKSYALVGFNLKLLSLGLFNGRRSSGLAGGCGSLCVLFKAIPVLLISAFAFSFLFYCSSLRVVDKHDGWRRRNSPFVWLLLGELSAIILAWVIY